MNHQAIRPCVSRQETVIGVVALVFALVAVSAILSGKDLFAQTNSAPTKRPHQREIITTGVGSPADQVKVGTATKDQNAPETLANQPPNPAMVRWDSRGLEIEASNASLDQILHQVAAQTGTRLDGRIWDQRIFGKYGPGPACDVLTKLLDGAGYNFFISGTRGSGVPREIILTSPSPTTPQTAAHRNAVPEGSTQPEPEPRRDDSTVQAGRQPNQDPFNIGGPPRDRVEFMQEILQRQNVIDQQQQQPQEQRNSP